MIRGPREIPERLQKHVRLYIAKPELYPEGVHELNGLTGRVVRFNPRSIYGQPCPGPAFLVELDQPVKLFSSQWVAKQDLRSKK
jgi:hypothetical protein